MQLFSYKNVSQIRCNTLATQCSFTDRLKLKIVNKIASRMPSADIHLIVSTLVGELLSCHDYFLLLSGFPDLFGKMFLINVKFS